MLGDIAFWLVVLVIGLAGLGILVRDDDDGWK